MRKYTFIGILSVVVILLGCKKFEHENIDLTTSCSLCSIANGIEGTYRGEVQGGFPGTPYVDSVTLTVDHIFLNNNGYDDSTTMYFAITHEMDTQNSPIQYDTIQIRSVDGDVWFKENLHLYINNNSAGRNTDFWMRNDTIYRKFYFQTMVGGNISYEGYFFKQ